MEGNGQAYRLTVGPLNNKFMLEHDKIPFPRLEAHGLLEMFGKGIEHGLLDSSFSI